MSRTRASEHREQNKKALLDILDTLPSIIARVDHDGRVDLVNRRFEQFSGMSASDAVGVPLADLIPCFAAQLRRVAEVIDSQTPLTNARTQCGSGADLRYYSLQIYPLNSGTSKMAVVRIDNMVPHTNLCKVVGMSRLPMQ